MVVAVRVRFADGCQGARRVYQISTGFFVCVHYRKVGNGLVEAVKQKEGKPISRINRFI